MLLNAIQNADLSTVRIIREQLSCPFLDFLMPLITALGNKGIFSIVLALIFITINKGKSRKTGIVMLIAILAGFLIGNLTLKPLFMRQRPCWIDSVPLLINNPHDYSFPSGHSLVAFETAMPIFMCLSKKWGTVATAIAVCIAFSRVYLYVHFPTDVISGALLGILFAILAKKLVDYIEKKQNISI